MSMDLDKWGSGLLLAETFMERFQFPTSAPHMMERAQLGEKIVTPVLQSGQHGKLRLIASVEYTFLKHSYQKIILKV